MDDMIGQSSSVTQSENQAAEKESIASQSQKPGKKPTRTILIVVGVLVLGTIVCIGVFLLGARNIAVEKAPIEEVLHSFMISMVARDTTDAYALFSTRAQRQVPISNLENLLLGNNYVLFDGYQSLSVQNLNLQNVVNTNPDIPSGYLANVTGAISYQDGFQGSITGLLEKENGKWRINSINITVPPEKFQP